MPTNNWKTSKLDRRVISEKETGRMEGELLFAFAMLNFKNHQYISLLSLKKSS